MEDNERNAAPGDDDRFAVSPEAIRAAVERHRGILRAGLYVPTRAEVLTMPIRWVADVLIDWVWESPSELIPSDEQVAAVIAALEARPDAATDEVRRLIAELRGEHS